MSTFGLGLPGIAVLAPYSSISLTATSPVQSFAEPLTVAEMRAYLKLPDREPADPAEDDLLGVFITAAREQAEILQNRDLVQKQFDLTRDYWPQYDLTLRSHLVSVDLVRRRDNTGAYTTLVQDTDFVVDSTKSPAIIVPPYGTIWPAFTPWPSSAILIRFTAGLSPTDAWWADAGARVKVGMKLLISNWYNGRMPFVQGRGFQELDFAVTACLSQGAVPRVR